MLIKFFTEFKSFCNNTEIKLGDMDGTGRSHGDNEGLINSVRDIIEKMDKKLQSVTEEVGRERNLRKVLEEKLDQLKRDLQAAENIAKDALQKAENNRDIDWGKRKSGKEGGCEGRGRIEERVVMLERRIEELEREAATLRVSSKTRSNHTNIKQIYSHK